MTVKFSRAAASQYYSTPDQPAFTIPASPGEWTMAFILTVDGITTGSGPQAIVSTGGYQESGNFNVFYNPAGEPTDRRSRVSVWLGTLSAPLFSTTDVLQAGETYLYVLYHTGTRLYAKRCPILATAPTVETAATLVTAQGSGARSIELDGLHGVFVGARTDLSSTRWLDQSVGRLFYMPGLLTDYEIAQLAYGKEITELGKQPIWYLRLDNVDDTQARGSSQAAFVKHGSPVNSTQQPAFGYVPTPPAPPVISGAPTIDGSPQVGVPSSYTPASVTGYPTPVRAQEWRVDGTVVGVAATYTPMSAEATKALTVRQIETSPGDGTTADATSAAKTIAPASSDTITVVAPTAETVKQRVGSSAPVPLSGTYTGATPVSIEYQLYSEDGMAVLRPWTALTATISGGNWSASPNIPVGGPYRVSVRGRSSTAVLGTSAIAPEVFLVGGIGACIGSSTPERWFNQSSGTPFLARSDVRRAINGAWTRFGVDGCAIEMANRIAAYTEMPIGLMDNGVSGTLLTEWTNPNGARWTAFKNAVAAVGNKLEFLIFSVGSNDLSNDAIASRASHLANLRLIVQNARAMTGQPNLPVFLSGVNRRVRTGLNEQMATDLRMAEGDLPEYEQYVGHIQTLDFDLSSDGTHLSSADAGMPAQARRIAYVVGRAIKDGIFVRGPKMAAYSLSGNEAIVTMVYRNGGASDFTPSTAITGFIGYGSSNSIAQLQSATRVDSSRIRLLFDAPVSKVTYLEGAGPAVGTPVYDNGAAALPMTVEAYLEPSASSGDTSAPALSGVVSVANITSNSATLTSPAGTDDVGVVGYEYRMNPTGGFTEIAGGARTVTVSGLTPSTQYQPQMQAFDAAGKRSMPISVSTPFTTSAAPDITAPVLPAPLVITPAVGGGTVAWSQATDNVGVVRYERQIDGGAWISTALVRTVTFTGLAGGDHPVSVRAVDAAGNYSNVLSGILTPVVDGGGGEANYVPSKVRTVKAKAGGGFTLEGPFWTIGAGGYPTGKVDPDSEVDITMDWSDVLLDITDEIAVGSIDVQGAVATSGFTSESKSTVFIDGPQSTGVTIRFRIQTASVPPRTEDRTVKLTVAEQ